MSANGIKRIRLGKETTSKKLRDLNVLIIDKYIKDIQAGEMRATDLAPVITLLKNNGIVMDVEDNIDDEAEILRLNSSSYLSLSTMDKLKLLRQIVLDKYIDAVEDDQLKAMELAPLVTMLKQNNVIAKEKVETKHDKFKEKINDDGYNKNLF